MAVEIFTLGGYGEIGRNMAAVKVDDDVIILDMGLHLEHYIHYAEDDDVVLDAERLANAGAVPDITPIKHLIKNVRAIVPSHAHLDHCGAIPWLANEFSCPIICTPFTKNVINTMVRDQEKVLKNEIIAAELNSQYKVNKNITVEFINATHSTPHTAIVVLHTKYGTIIYANDFKLDDHPTLGEKTNTKRLREIGTGNVICLIQECLYADQAGKMPSESLAREKLDEVLSKADKKKAIIVTTFSSHIARLKSIYEIGRKAGRKVIFLGRSMHKYITAAEDAGIVNLSGSCEVIKYKQLIKKRLRRIFKEGKKKYLIVCTGHQGEPKAVLHTITKQRGFLERNDLIIFSCITIPTKTTIENRKHLEKKLLDMKIKIIKDIHVSGHAASEDLKEILKLLNPENVIPVHGDIGRMECLKKIAEELGINTLMLTEGEHVAVI